MSHLAFGGISQHLMSFEIVCSSGEGGSYVRTRWHRKSKPVHALTMSVGCGRLDMPAGNPDRPKGA